MTEWSSYQSAAMPVGSALGEARKIADRRMSGPCDGQRRDDGEKGDDEGAT